MQSNIVDLHFPPSPPLSPPPGLSTVECCGPSLSTPPPHTHTRTPPPPSPRPPMNLRLLCTADYRQTDLTQYFAIFRESGVGSRKLLIIRHKRYKYTHPAQSVHLLLCNCSISIEYFDANRFCCTKRSFWEFKGVHRDSSEGYLQTTLCPGRSIFYVAYFVLLKLRKHAYIILTTLNPTFI